MPVGPGIVTTPTLPMQVTFNVFIKFGIKQLTISLPYCKISPLFLGEIYSPVTRIYCVEGKEAIVGLQKLNQPSPSTLPRLPCWQSLSGFVLLAAQHGQLVEQCTRGTGHPPPG